MYETNSTKIVSQLIKIVQAICDSHLKEKLNEESIAVAQINSSDMLKNSICNRGIGPLLKPHTHLLTNDRLEMCLLLLDQFNKLQMIVSV